MKLNEFYFLSILGIQILGGCSHLPKAKSFDSSMAVTTIAIGSCADQDRPQPLWQTILMNKPDLFLFTGDTVYASTPDKVPVDLQYEKLGRNVDFRSFWNKVPIFPIWDDHDFGVNDGGGDWNQKLQFKQSFLQFWDPRGQLIPSQQEGLYYAKTISSDLGHRIHLIFLDMRYHRSPLSKNPDTTKGAARFIPNADPSATFLGETQWRWFSEQLRHPADFHFVISSTQVLAESPGFEKWSNFPREKEKLFSLIRESKVKNLLLVSGDRHLGVMARQVIPGWGALTEFTSSGINKPSLAKEPERDPLYLEEAYIKLNFGLMRFDWIQKKLLLELRNQENEVVRSAEVSILNL